jgi:predicted RNase H-like HicB family nuclease
MELSCAATEATSHRKDGMLRDYLTAALRRARYEILTDDGSFYGDIPGFEGVYANAATLEACREELEEVLEEWVLFRVSRDLGLPEVDGKQLRIRKVS